MFCYFFCFAYIFGCREALEDNVFRMSLFEIRLESYHLKISLNLVWILELVQSITKYISEQLRRIEDPSKFLLNVNEIIGLKKYPQVFNAAP